VAEVFASRGFKLLKRFVPKLRVNRISSCGIAHPLASYLKKSLSFADDFQRANKTNIAYCPPKFGRSPFPSFSFLFVTSCTWHRQPNRIGKQFESIRRMPSNAFHINAFGPVASLGAPVESAEPVCQPSAKSHAYKSVVGSERLSYVGHRPSEGSRGTALYRRESLLVSECDSDALRVEGVESRPIPRIIFGEQLAARLYHDALGYELEDGTAPMKRARLPLVGGILEA
jgi:hypothetical protein